MKICAIICEYNPFHNGHLHHLRTAKQLSGADYLLCVMGGNFVQRGESAVMEKYTRAKHAVLAGADAVIELPTPFATANAELFAKGALRLLSAIPAVKYLCFGAENADKSLFLKAATLLNDEPKEISEKIKTFMANGISYARARAEAWAKILPETFLSSPNNALGVEYARAILASNADIDILPIPRINNGYKETSLTGKFSSATAIRGAITKGKPLDGVLPDFVLADLPNKMETSLDTLEKYAILSRSNEEIARVCDCTEGLENAFKKAALHTAPLVDTLTSARYTSSRIRRIALQNLLRIDERLIRRSLQTPLYLRVLAAKKDATPLLSALGESNATLLVRAHDEKTLQGIARECYERDIFAEKVYSLLYPFPTKKLTFY